MTDARCQILVTERKVSDCGKVRVSRGEMYPDDRVLRYVVAPGQPAEPWCNGTIARSHARDLALALLAYLDGPEAK